MLNIIPIVFCFNEGYVIPAGVCIFSLLKNAGVNTFYAINVFYKKGRLSEDSKTKILELKDLFNNCSIDFIDIGDSFSNVYEVKDFTIENYFRLAIPKYLSCYDKVVYCDSDTIVTQDLAGLFATNIKGYSIAAVKDGTVMNNRNFRTYVKKVQLVPEKYFNSGVLIFNNKKINEEGGVDSKIEDLLQKKFRYVDQDILNKAFGNDTFYLNKTFNYTVQHLFGRFKDIKPHIVHYVYQKPWKHVSAFGDMWWHYYIDSPFYDHGFYMSYVLGNYSDIDKHILIGKKLKSIGVYTMIKCIRGILFRMGLIKE